MKNVNKLQKKNFNDLKKEMKTYSVLGESLDKTEFNVKNPSNITVDIPCGGFRFIDVELENEI